MSRFFATGDSDSETSESSSADELQQQLRGDEANAKFMMSSSESEDEKRVVKTPKAKFWDEIRNQLTAIRNHGKINDWGALAGDFDEMMKVMDRAKNVSRMHGVPRFFFKGMLELEEKALVMKKDKKAAKKLSKPNSRGLMTVNQKMKKIFRERYVQEIKAYEANPLGDDEEDEDEDEEEKPKKTRVASSHGDDESDEGDDDDESDEGDDDDEDWSDDDWINSDGESGDDSDLDMNASMGVQFTRAFWVKKKTTDTGKDKEAKRAAKAERVAAAKAAKEAKKAEAAKAKAAEKKEEEGVEFTPKMVIEKLKELQALRGKRGTDRKQMVKDLIFLGTKADKVSKAAVLHVKTTLIIAYFDLALNRGLFLPVELWKNILGVLVDVIDTLQSDPMVRLAEDEQVDRTFEDEFDEQGAMSLDAVNELMEDKEKDEEEKKKEEEELQARLDEEASEIQYVKGNLFSFVGRLYDEYRKSLQNIDPHKSEYVQRLRDEPQLLGLLERTQGYYEQIGKMEYQAQVALMRLELHYYAYDATRDPVAVKAKQDAEAAAGDEEKKEEGSKKPASFGAAGLLRADDGKVAQLAAFMYKNGNSRQRMRALLCHVYHLAMHNKYQAARDLMLMSHAQDTISAADIKTRILYNRVMAQLGMCAFRCGEVRHALFALGDLYQSNRTKELLAQGVQMRWNREKNAQKEKLEKLRQYPYHMHMNMDMLEATHLLSCMLIEVPYVAQHGETNKRRNQSKAFRRLFDHHKKQAFNGPPDNTRDLVMACIKALLAGDWQKCVGYASKLRMWKIMPNSETVMAMFTQRVKEEALRTHLLRYSKQYTSLSLDSLTAMFSLDARTVHRITSKMMVTDQLRGAWDQPTASIIMHDTQAQSALQSAALAYSGKVVTFSEQNERLVDHRSGWKNNQKGGWRDGKNNRGGNWKNRSNKNNRK